MALSSNPITIKPSPSEVKNKALNQKNLEIAVRALARDGLVVVEDLVPHSVLDTLNEKMIQDAYKLQSMENSPYNFNKGNLQQDPLMTKDFFFQDVFVNPIVTQISSTVLGPNPSLRFISGNTAFPPTASVPPQSQPIHNDADFDHPAIPFALVINVPLVTMTPENGSTEIWLGTHANTTISDQEGAHGDRASGRIKQHLLEQQRSVRPPSQPIVKKGSVVIRDLRLWHGGKPNLSQEPRVMLAFIHFAPWYRNQMTVEVAKELKDELSIEKAKLHVAAKFLDSKEVEKTYLNRPYGNAYDFDQIEKIEGLF